MTTVYECDYNGMPFEKAIEILFGDSLGYSDYALKRYLEHGYIYLDSCGKVYGVGRTSEVHHADIVRTSTILIDYNIGSM